MVSERLRERIEAAGVNQSELARRVGITQGTIAGLISGRSRSSSHLHKIARVLGTTPAYLEGEIDDPAGDAPPAVADLVYSPRYYAGGASARACIGANVRGPAAGDGSGGASRRASSASRAATAHRFVAAARSAALRGDAGRYHAASIAAYFRSRTATMTAHIPPHGEHASLHPGVDRFTTSFIILLPRLHGGSS